MRVFIDSRDLIDIFNESKPIDPAFLADVFTRNGHHLVLTSSLISELVPRDNNPIVVARRLVTIEERIPHVFLRQNRLAEADFAAEASAFGRGDPPSTYNPYAQRWCDIWGGQSDPLMLIDLDRRLDLRKMSTQIDLVVRQDPAVFHWSDEETTAAVSILQDEQSLVTRGDPKATFRQRVDRWARRAAVSLSDTQTTEFATFLRRNPRVAPGWRLYGEVFDQMARDAQYRPSVNDVWDLAHVTLLPFVDMTTLDKHKVDLVRRATDRLRTFDPTLDYCDRSVSNVSELLRRLTV